MDKRIKTIRGTKKDIAMWIGALYSGAFKQGQSRLEVELPDGGKGYCCLGVLQKVKAGVVEKDLDTQQRSRAKCYPTESWLEKNGIQFFRVVDDDGTTVPSTHPSVYSESYTSAGVEFIGYIGVDVLNDGTGINVHSFFDIAALILNHVEYTD